VNLRYKKDTYSAALRHLRRLTEIDKVSFGKTIASILDFVKTNPAPIFRYTLTSKVLSETKQVCARSEARGERIIIYEYFSIRRWNVPGNSKSFFVGWIISRAM